MNRMSGAFVLVAAALLAVPGAAGAQGRDRAGDKAKPAATRTGGAETSGRKAASGTDVAQNPGRGNADRAQQGRGSADRAQQGRGNADRAQQGRGNADRAQQGRGNADRAQQGRGNADRAQQGRGSVVRAQQGRGGGQGVGRAGESAADPPGRARGRASGIPAARLRSGMDRLDPAVRPFASSSRAHERHVAGAAARGLVRGANRDDLRIEPVGERLRVLNRRGDILLELGDDDARRLGAWDVRRLGDRRPAANAPAFCRSGAGHPGWGREWCLDKGFGLGSQRGYVWGRSPIDDIIWRRTDRERLDRGGLIDVLGDVVFGRLALHALSLGVTEPIAGVWRTEPDSPRILQVNAGSAPIAEFVDLDRDDEVDVLFIVTPLW